MGDLTFSVVICTYNHAHLLAGALETVCRQSFDRSQYEVIVVDNNSTDDTRLVLEAQAKRYPGIQYCVESVQGLSHARNRGWRQSRGRYVAYIDDDCRAPEQWLRTAAEIVDTLAPMAFGGPYDTAFDGAKPRWASDSMNSYVPGPEARILGADEFGWLVGGNIFFQRTLFDTVGGFDPRFGHVGETLAYGDESMLVKQISERFPGTLYYDPRLVVDHLVRPEKLTLWYNVRGAFGSGRYMVRRRNPATRGSSGRLLLSAGVTTLLLAADLLVRTLLRDRRKYPYVRNYVDGHTLGYVRRLGSLYEEATAR